MEILAENKLDFKEFEQLCFDIGMQYARNLMAESLTKLDLKLMTTRDTQSLRHKGLKPMTIKTLMGEVSVDRRIYKQKTESGEKIYRFLLDEVIGKDTIGEVSIGLILRMASEITEQSYRSTAKAISSMTGQSISHTGVWNIIQSLGDRLEKMDENRAEAAKNFVYPGEKSVPILLEEYDGIWINMQGECRPKKGGKQEMKVSVTYEGTEISGKDKDGKDIHKRTNPLYMVGFEKTDKFFEKKEGQLASIYNLDEVTTRLINGDGGEWIKACEEKTAGNTYFQLDQFHIKKAIKEKGVPKELQNGINKLLSNHRVDSAITYIQYLMATELDKAKKDKLKELYSYLNNHKDFLIPIRERSIEELKEFEHISNAKMGSAETTVCSVVALRMKKRRASFSKSGATNLARLLALKRGNLLDETVSLQSSMLVPIEFEEVITTGLTAAKAPKLEGKGFNYPYKGAMPFEGQFTTNGRKAIRNMLNNRNYSELVYR